MLTFAPRIALAGLSLAAMFLSASPAVAHPLGNFTTNRYGGLEVSTGSVRINYVVDMAEIPTVQELQSISGGDPDVSQEALNDYAAKESKELLIGITLLADGDEVRLRIESADASLLPGQGGLDVLRMEAIYVGELPTPETTLQYTDLNYASRRGWKEVVVTATGEQGLVSSSAPSESISDELRDYPRDLLSDPPEVTTARIKVAPGATGSGAPVDEDELESDANRDVVGEWFTSLIERDFSPAFLVVAVLVALGAGALHALQPGHGKTILAAYLVGSAGRFRHALALGVAVSLMHTTSVVALGLVTLWASSAFSPDEVYPWLSLFSGVVVVSVGAWLLWRRLTTGGHAHPPHDGNPDHAHSHDHALPAGVSPFSIRGMGAVAISGGLLPSPAALIVLLGAISLHRIAFGVTLVAAFSIGLAAALTAVGMLVIRARDLTTRRMGSNAARMLALLSAGAIVALGLVLTARAALSF